MRRSVLSTLALLALFVPAAFGQAIKDPAEVMPARALAYAEVRQPGVFLKEFVTNPNVDVRRSLISRLKLDASACPQDLQPLVARAIEIARSHPDAYIRHRVEVSGVTHYAEVSVMLRGA